MSAIPPVTGSSKPKPEQVAAIVALLADREQVCMDILAALAVIPPADLANILRAAARGWEQDKAGHYSIKVGKAQGRPVLVRLQPGDELIGPDRRR